MDGLYKKAVSCLYAERQDAAAIVRAIRVGDGLEEAETAAFEEGARRAKEDGRDYEGLDPNLVAYFWLRGLSRRFDMSMRRMLVLADALEVL